MDAKSAIILLSTLLPAIAVGYILRTNGKTINFAVVGAVIVYIVSVATTYVTFYLSSTMNLQATDMVLVTPIVIAAVFYFLLKGLKIGNDPNQR